VLELIIAYCLVSAVHACVAARYFFSQVRFVYPVKYIFFTTGYTTGYGKLVAFVAY